MLPSPPPGHALVTPALAHGKPLGGQGQTFAFGQDDARQRRGQLRAQRQAAPAFVLEIVQLWGGGGGVNASAVSDEKDGRGAEGVQQRTCCVISSPAFRVYSSSLSTTGASHSSKPNREDTWGVATKHPGRGVRGCQRAGGKQRSEVHSTARRRPVAPSPPEPTSRKWENNQLRRRMSSGGKSRVPLTGWVSTSCCGPCFSGVADPTARPPGGDGAVLPAPATAPSEAVHLVAARCLADARGKAAAQEHRLSRDAQPATRTRRLATHGSMARVREPAAVGICGLPELSDCLVTVPSSPRPAARRMQRWMVARNE